jgi:hypothetical protein
MPPIILMILLMIILIQKVMLTILTMILSITQVLLPTIIMILVNHVSPDNNFGMIIPIILDDPKNYPDDSATDLDGRSYR